jgi:hypothetical protein
MWISTMVFNASNRNPGALRPVALAGDVWALTTQAAADGVIDADEAAQLRGALRLITPPSDHDRRLLQSLSRPRRLPGQIAPMCSAQLQRHCGNPQQAPSTTVGPLPPVVTSSPLLQHFATLAQVLRPSYSGTPRDSDLLDIAHEDFADHLHRMASTTPNPNRELRVFWASKVADNMLASPTGTELTQEQQLGLRAYLEELAQ